MTGGKNNTKMWRRNILIKLMPLQLSLIGSLIIHFETKPPFSLAECKGCCTPAASYVTTCHKQGDSGWLWKQSTLENTCACCQVYVEYMHEYICIYWMHLNAFMYVHICVIQFLCAGVTIFKCKFMFIKIIFCYLYVKYWWDS